ncbi:metalloprotease atp23 [Phaffia rhodozyma]|uniref:Mitochondrial inner membrane protease ATP23 n=1 Tax=Phaffia rhodozyma TaxID=264483 RepID=A0A0F7SVK9_PHARH|nr:metalloprotease atp23 [Phaffia rhodozyma]
MSASNAQATPETEPKFFAWLSALSHVTGLGQSATESSIDQTEEFKRLQKEEAEWTQCEKWKSYTMKWDPSVVFILKHLSLSGCPTTAASIHCAPCDNTKAGGFSSDLGVLLCQNRLVDKAHMGDTLSHELIHMYDHCKFNVDWTNLRHHACSEIRAANLSGDCAWWQEFKRGHYETTNAQAKCVRRRAILSVEANPACPSRKAAEEAVDDVWDSCKPDTRPFDRLFK